MIWGSKDLVVYVAGPIRCGDLTANIRQANDAGAALLKAGVTAIVPHGSCFFGNKVVSHLFHEPSFIPEVMPCGTSHEDWMGYDLPLVRRCDAILRLPGLSAGADFECEEAALHAKPIFYHVEDVIEWARLKRAA